MSSYAALHFRSKLGAFIRITCYYLILASISHYCQGQPQQEASISKSSEPFTIELYHKFDSIQEFKPRGSILVKPKTDHRIAQASINQEELTDSDLKTLKEASEKGDTYYLKATLRTKKGDRAIPIKTTQTLVKSCSLYASNLADFITVNLGPSNDFISVNIFTTEPECIGQPPNELSKKFNTAVLVESVAVGPAPDTETYIVRIEEETRNKSKQGKEDNRSFFAKYWIYIVPAIIILMVFSGPQEGAAR